MSPAPLGRRFLTVWVGQTASLVGSAVSGVGVAVWVYLETGSAAWLGVLAAMAAVPAVLAGPFLPIVDRFPRRTTMRGGYSIPRSTRTAIMFISRWCPWAATRCYGSPFAAG